MKLICKIFSVFNNREKIYCAGIIFFMLIGAVLEAIGIGAILPLISIMGDSLFLEKHKEIQPFLKFIGVYTQTAFVMISSFLVMFIYIFKNFYMTWLTRLQIYFSLKKQVYFARRLLELYMNKSYIYYSEQNTAILLRNISNGVRVVFTDIIVSVFGLITEIVTAITIWIMLVCVDPITAVCVAGVLGSLMYFILKGLKNKITIYGNEQNKYFAEYVKWINQSFGSIKETKVMHKELYFINSFYKSYKKYGETYAGFLFFSQVPRMIIEAIVTTGLIIVIVVKLWLGYNPEDIVPLLGVLALASFRLMPCANRIVTLINSIKFNMPLFEILYDDLLNIKYSELGISSEINEASNVSKQIFKKEIKIKRLWFQYPKRDQWVLRDISFTIPKGSFVGIMGESGAGKTTFIDILLGLLEPANGEITVDGDNIFENVFSWQALLAYVPQNIYLIDGTIKENIAFGIPDEKVDQSKLVKVLKMAELYDVVELLPDNVDTEVGECGIKLSGGQKQRIGIARALYSDPEILILDEATSALDDNTEKSVTETILKLKGKITIIAIAHRMSTLEKCDFKIKFENGKAKVI